MARGKWIGSLAAAAVLAAAAGPAAAGEIEPRAYVNTPVGVNFLLGGFVYTSGGLSTTGSSPLKDANLTIRSGVLAYARSLDFWGRSGKVDVIVPVSDFSGSAMVNGNPVSREISGLNDPLVRLSVNFVGAPAVTVEEFKDYRQDLLAGASLQVSAPLGQYDPSRLVNIGNNRWFFKPEVGVSKAWGDFTLELSTGVFLFTRNDEYFGGTTLDQAPLLTAQAHATYNVAKGVWAAVSTTVDYGGRTSTNGVENGDEQRNARAGATLALPVNRRNSVKLYGSTSYHTTVGKDYDILGIAWQYRWGAGL